MRHALPMILAAVTAITFSSDPLLAQGRSDCPPGLAKKDPPCVPPGLARKGADRGEVEARRDRDDRDDYVYDRWQRGDRLPADRYVILGEGDRVIFEGREYIVVDTDNGTVLKRGNDWYRLPRYDESEYVRIGDAILRVDRETRAVIELIQLADLILS